MVLTWWDEKNTRYRVAVGYVGEEIEANTWYVVDAGKIVKDTNQND